jgi:hypothetical protein
MQLTFKETITSKDKRVQRECQERTKFKRFLEDVNSLFQAAAV